MWRASDPQGNESRKVKYDIVPYTRGKGLDVGCGPFKAYDHFIGVDNLNHQQFGWDIKPDIVSEANDLSIFGDNSLDFVYSSHTLEHVEKPKEVLKEWWRVIKDGGYLVLYLPHRDFYPNIGEEGANPDHKSDFKPEHITGIMKTIGSFDLAHSEERNYDFGEDDHRNEYSFLQVYQKKTGNNTYSCQDNKGKKAAVVRYGGFGDMIQAASVFPELKKQGFHVTVITTPKGQDILKKDPHIDEFKIQDVDQVPNNELSGFFESQAKYYDRFINLSESVEATLLTMPGRTIDKYPDALRRQINNVNYLERTHDIAEVPYDFHALFYPTTQEIEWAQEEKKNMGGLTIMVALSGSALHKINPYIDNIMARYLLKETDVNFVTVGDNFCQILEGASWDNEPRVHTRAGVWSIRESLAFAMYGADIVIGPETGILNAVGLMDVPKVINLSHSSEENLTKHWKNTGVLTSNSDCHPCHRMHYGKGNCPFVEIGTQHDRAETPACTDISIDLWCEAIDTCIKQTRDTKWRPRVVQTLA